MQKTDKTVSTVIDDQEFGKVLLKNISIYSQATFLRAIPDYRDNLKVVARRIIFTMWKENINHFVKVLAVCGDVLKIHPYNDAAISDAIVLMAQPQTTPFPYFDGQGNYGSSEDLKSYAASRYIETKLSKFCQDVITDEIDEYSIDYINNYDDTRKEILYLPSKIPLNLLQGDYGIAEAYIHSVPSHNINDLVDICIKYIQNKNISLKELVKDFYPDFPTGGIITNKKEINKIYSMDIKDIETMDENNKISSTIKLKGKITIDNDQNSILITELPYGVSFQKIKDTITEEVKNKGNLIFSNIVNFGNRKLNNNDVIFEIFCKKGINLQEVVNQIYLKTAMTKSISLQFIYNFDGVVKRCTIKDVIKNWYDTRIKTLRRKYNAEHSDIQNKTHVLQGILSIYDVMKEAINKIMKCENKEEAIKMLCKDYKLSLIQSKGIIELQISTLTRMNKNKIINDINRNIKKINEIDEKIYDIDTVIINQLLEIKQKYGRTRRTILEDNDKIINNITISNGLLTYNKDSIGIFDKNAIVNGKNIIQGLKNYKINGKFIKEINGIHYILKDIISILVFTSDNFSKRINVNEIDITNNYFTNTSLDKENISVVPIYTNDDNLIIINNENKIKKVKAIEFNNKVTNSGIKYVYNQGDNEDSIVLLYDEDGNYNYIEGSEIPLLGKNSAGNLINFDKNKKLFIKVFNNKETSISLILTKKNQDNLCYIYNIDIDDLIIRNRIKKPIPFFDNLSKNYKFNNLISINNDIDNIDSQLILFGPSSFAKIKYKSIRQKYTPYLIKCVPLFGIQIL
jgi:DNA gyrase/topoisomerase IV subunit A